MEYSSVLKRREWSAHENIVENLEFILQINRYQFEKATYCTIPTIGHSGKSKTIGNSGFQRLWEREGWIGKV